MVIIGAVTITLLMLPPFRGSKHIRMNIIKNKTPILSIDQPHNPSYIIDAMISTIDFPIGDIFKHSKLGAFGVQNDFFAEFNCILRVKKAGSYFFRIGSDDGFRLFIGTNMIGEFGSGRQYQENIYKVTLRQDDQPFSLIYFQGYGPLGLRAYYQREGDVHWSFIGENSAYIKFLKQ